MSGVREVGTRERQVKRVGERGARVSKCEVQGCVV